MSSDHSCKLFESILCSIANWRQSRISWNENRWEHWKSLSARFEPATIYCYWWLCWWWAAAASTLVWGEKKQNFFWFFWAECSSLCFLTTVFNSANAQSISNISTPPPPMQQGSFAQNDNLSTLINFSDADFAHSMFIMLTPHCGRGRQRNKPLLLDTMTSLLQPLQRGEGKNSHKMQLQKRVKKTSKLTSSSSRVTG